MGFGNAARWLSTTEATNHRVECLALGDFAKRSEDSAPLRPLLATHSASSLSVLDSSRRSGAWTHEFQDVEAEGM